MSNHRRITANLPAELLDRAQAATGMGITETLVLGLESLMRLAAVEDLKKLRGKIHIREDGGRKSGSARN